MSKGSNKSSKQNENIALKKAKRCQFTMPEEDDELIDELVLKYQKLVIEKATEPVKINRSMIIRAGIRVLENYKEKDFSEAVGNVEKLKVGRRSEDEG